MRLSDDIEAVKGVGPSVAVGLRQLGIKTVFDLVDYLPTRYEDYSEVVAIRDTQPGPVTIRGVIKDAKGRYVRRGMHITEAVVSDETGSVRAIWFNQPYRAAALKPGQEYFLSGQYELSHQRFQLMNPSAELVKDFPLNTARIVPIYRQSKAIKTNQIRKLIGASVATMRTLPETLPSWMVTEAKLLSRPKAIEAMHYPESSEQLAQAKRRLGFEEVLELSLASLLNKQENAREHALPIPFNEKLAKDFVAHLPFSLTDDQRRVVWQIYQDLGREQPMNRLVEGDVGAGKTVVAAMAAVMAMQQGYQVALMAPTELLARQHATSLAALLRPLKLDHEVLLLVGGLGAAEKKRAQVAIAAGHAKFLVGTNALIQDKVDMHKLGLIIVDEQHRFGVDQRKALMAKAGHMPHVLSLTATPIPRSLALTLYGELDISVLKTKPAGRLPIVTKLVTPASRNALYQKVKLAVEAGQQAFVVCPLIESSDTSQESRGASVLDVYAELQKKQLAGCHVGLLHGKMKPAEKDAVMQQFVQHELDVLVATTVIEVGVDVPNASIMVIESAERFGLAQLHQLRGRVGRGDQQAYCHLLLSDNKAPSTRLRAIESSQDGFRLAELDLEIRGPGAIYGAMQHGALDLRVVRLSDTQLIAEARQAAQTFIDKGENLLHYTELCTRVQRLRAVTNLN
ncbi:MAG: ATP-dependent DNA helicase RecG [Candidatus Saccharimonadales bacterium]